MSRPSWLRWIRPIWLWSFRSKLFVSVLALSAAVGGGAYYAKLTDEPIFGAVSAGLAAGSLFVVAFSAYHSTQRSKRKDTLEAYVKWSDDHRAARRRVTDALGAKKISKRQAKGLAGQGPLVRRDGTPIDKADAAKIQHDVVDTLNGLERLAVGVEAGVYDVMVLRTMGGTIILRTYDRLKPYIDVRRSQEQGEKRQLMAYRELDVLVWMLDSRRLVEMVRDTMRTIDDGRLRIMGKQHD